MKAEETIQQFDRLYKFGRDRGILQGGVYNNQKKEDLARFFLKRYLDLKTANAEFREILTEIKNERLSNDLFKVINEVLEEPMPGYMKRFCNAETLNDFMKFLSRI